MSNAIELVNLEDKASKAMSSVLEKANAFVIKDEVSYNNADALISEVRSLVEARKEELGPTKDAATKTWQAACALWKKFVTDPLEVCKTLDRKRYQWKKAENERLAMEAEEARKAEQAKAAEERLAVATRLEAAGMKEQAEKVLNAPVAATGIVATQISKPVDQVEVENWQAQITDPEKVPREFCIPDLVKLNKFAKMTKGMALVPGVTFTDIGTVRRRS
jgi:hypothetical protein